MYKGIDYILKELEKELADIDKDFFLKEEDYEDYLAECMYWQAMEELVNREEV